MYEDAKHYQMHTPQGADFNPMVLQAELYLNTFILRCAGSMDSS